MKNYVIWFIIMVVLIKFFEQDNVLPRKSVDLGVAQYPLSGETEYLEAQHRWQQPASRSTYRLMYRHGERTALARHEDHARIGRKFRFTPARDGSFSWRTARDCQSDWGFSNADTWSCVYSQVLASNERDLAPILERVSAGLTAEQFSQVEASRWLLDFVQTIPYKIPEKHAFGLLPPALVASENWGDCDSKSLLLIALLRYFGIEAHMMISQAHQHAMVAVPVANSARNTFKINGQRYAWAETTANAPLGWIQPDMLRPNDWQAVRVAQK